MKKPNLPRCVHKYQLRDYFDCTYDFLWSRIITDELLLSWGFDLDEIRRVQQFDHRLTFRIYIHFKITDLDADLSAEVQRAIEGKTCPL